MILTFAWKDGFFYIPALVIGVLLPFSGHADTGPEVKHSSARSEIDVRFQEINNRIAESEKSVAELRSTILEREENIQAREAQLLNALEFQQKALISIGNEKEKIQAELDSDHGLSFATWTGILLACVSVIVTVLGVVIAILSFFGYRATIEKAKKIALKSADKSAREEVRGQIENGRFDKLIMKL